MRICSFGLFLIFAAPVLADSVTAPSVTLEYKGIEKSHAQAIADVLSAARKVYLDDLALPMPPRLTAAVTCAPGQRRNLYTDGADHVTLNIASPDNLRRPSASGAFNVYGLCHELGHIGMYRILKQTQLFSGGALEGWAHYTGSVVLDRVYEAKGEQVWTPDPYDYRPDGSPRLTRQLAAEKQDDVTRGAGAWLALEKIIGRRSFAKVFEAWQETLKEKPAADGSLPGGPDPDELLAALIKLHPDKKVELEAWWKTARPALIEPIELSPFKTASIDMAKLTGKPQTLTPDDNAADGKLSMTGGAHARRLSAPSEKSYLTSVQFHAGRYGSAQAPDTRFDLVLCDDKMRPIARWTFPYDRVARGESQWIKLDLPKPALLPKEFCLCLNFRPSFRSGIYLSYDSSTTGASTSTLPGKPMQKYDKGDWMIRATISEP